MNRHLHWDKIMHQPANVRFVGKMVLDAMRYYLENYEHTQSGGRASTIDPPDPANFPEYVSIEFSARVAIDQDILTQPSLPAAAPNNNGDIDGAFGGDEGTGTDDFDDDARPIRPSALDDPQFNPDLIPDDETAIDLFNFGDTFLCPFTTVLFVPFSASEDWARAYSFVCKNLMDANLLPSSDPTRHQRIIRWSLWFSGLPQIILRTSGRGPMKDTTIIKMRLHQLLNGNFKALLTHWARYGLKHRARIRKPRKDTSDARTSRAVNDILSGDVSRGLRLHRRLWLCL